MAIRYVTQILRLESEGPDDNGDFIVRFMNPDGTVYSSQSFNDNDTSPNDEFDWVVDEFKDYYNTWQENRNITE